MREIKFRAWMGDKILKDIVIVSPEITKFGSALNIGIKDFIEQGEGEYILMQYTGLKDKNGKEIYEGDIIGCENCMNSYILWEDGAFCISGDNDVVAQSDASQWEVIGNIYENPELVKEE